MRMLGQPSRKVANYPVSTIPLSEAILLGSVKRPQKIGGFQDIINGELRSTCAIVAAFDGIGIMEDHIKTENTLEVWKVFPILIKPMDGCPECKAKTTESLLESTELSNVAVIIAHLNDDHKWTRPQIADWVKGIEEQETNKQVKVEQQASEVMV